MRKARLLGVPFVIVRMECRGHLMRVMGFPFDLMMYRPFGSVLGKWPGIGKVFADAGLASVFDEFLGCAVGITYDRDTLMCIVDNSSVEVISDGWRRKVAVDGFHCSSNSVHEFLPVSLAAVCV